MKAQFTRMVPVVIATLAILTAPAIAGGPETKPNTSKAPVKAEVKAEVKAKEAKANAPVTPKAKAKATPAPKAAPRRMPKPDVGVPSARTVRAMMGAAAKHLPFKKLKIRTSDVYFGNYRRFHRAAVIDTQKVFNAISHYQELRRLGLDKNSGRYWVLLQRSNRVFHRALRKIAKDRGYQLIGARGAIVVDGKAPDDVTDAVLKVLPSIRTH